MKIVFSGLIAALVLFFSFGLTKSAKAAEQDQTAAGVALPKGFRIANFTCW